VSDIPIFAVVRRRAGEPHLGLSTIRDAVRPMFSIREVGRSVRVGVAVDLAPDQRTIHADAADAGAPKPSLPPPRRRSAREFTNRQSAATTSR
jgi:hypothetical protein